jgi:hypothetical protein
MEERFPSEGNMSQTTAASIRPGTRKEVIHGNARNFDEVIMAKRPES